MADGKDKENQGHEEDEKDPGQVPGASAAPSAAQLTPGPDDLQLAQSGPFVRGNVLARRTTDGKITGEHDLQDVYDVALRSDWDGTLVALAVLLGGGSYVCYAGVENIWGKVLGGLLLGTLAVAALVGGLRSRRIVITMKHGKVSFPASDDAHDCQSFCLTLTDRLEKLRRGRMGGL
jgi:hypothetical protein